MTAAVSVDIEGGTLRTLDWFVFLAAEAKVRDEFEGNVLISDPSTNLETFQICEIMSVVMRPRSKFPDERKLRIEGCATKEDLTHPAEIGREGQRYLMVGKDGNT
ncbi:hypothetical protein POSPLADRAFT_1074650 [Postia placenta MAD-698-R-SB12]|uniref:Uncharacterized protein n=1 Tax=Postia placenta MAD-698-R-SB12 TaxID=670580 RepID=A0A1X6MZH3_9APHY|nr:hypothetical protein POSPLADRAFT_1074650 [Postia placenta MAD-698-R-SB12]OSX61771.1 hypothetical protein POSPLADRAFT_1074650 [Postia placenta MAD-698-R-SB12]